MAEFNKNQPYQHVDHTVQEVKGEVEKGLQLLNTVNNKLVTVFGSHITPSTNKYFKICEELVEKLGKRGFGVVTGGGPGAMKAANLGAIKTKVPSFGLKAEMLTWEQVNEPIYTHVTSFRYFFVRRFLLSVKSNILIFMPGGYGTLDELFEYLMLTETGSVKRVPIVLVGKKFWKGMFEWLEEAMLSEGLLPHGKEDLKLVHIVDTVSEALKAIDSYDDKNIFSENTQNKK